MWEKKTTDSFDITMGSFDSVQITDLEDTLGRFLNFNIVEINRDDGLISISNSNGPLTSKIQKKVIRAFKYMGLKIEISSNLKKVNFFRCNSQFK